MLREQDSNLRPCGYEPHELPTALSRDMWRIRDLNPVPYACKAYALA